MNKTLWTTALAAIATAGALLSAPASANTSIHVQVGPPAPLYEVVPQPQPGYLWVPGHWEWRGHRHVWIAGHHLRERPGYVYQQPVWVQRGNQWSWYGGGWSRSAPAHAYGHQHGRGHDRDRDGIPNRYDRDRDGDGVANRYDRRPDDARRR